MDSIQELKTIFDNIFLAITPAETRARVKRPEKCPPPRRSLKPLYFIVDTKSECPGRGCSLKLLYDFESTSLFLKIY